MKKTTVLLFFTICLLSFTGCNISVAQTDKYLYISESAEYAVGTEEQTPEDAAELDFKPFNIHVKANLKPYSDLDGSYLWVRFHFKIPEYLKNKDLGLEIPYLHFAEKAYLNGVFVGQYGRFPPKATAAQYRGHCFLLSQSDLIQDGENEILLKVFCMGNSTVSDRLFIGEQLSIVKISRTIDFLKSSIYLLFEGAMFTSAVLFFLLYIYKKRNRSYFAFSILNTLTTILCIPFFSAELPFYTSFDISHFTFMKMTMYCIMPLATFSASEFMLMFVEYESPKWVLNIRLFVTFLTFAAALFAPKYSILMKACPIITILLFLQLLSGFYIPLITPKKSANMISLLKKLLIGFTPLACGMLIDVFLKLLVKDDLLPYFTVFGFFISDIFFFLSFTINFNRTSIQAEFLNSKLEQEVFKQTRQLSEAKASLEHEIKRAKTDLEMAAIVQAGFLPPKCRRFKQFELSVFYQPLSNVSGDFYDFYEKDNHLEGFSIFDVSGHGIAASLITLLGKNIVSECFYKGAKNSENISTTLSNINTRVCLEKGNVENYLTGLLFKIDENASDNKKTYFTFANAGHPHPLLYRSRINDVIELRPEDGQVQYGAVGLFENEISYVEIGFAMEQNDILLCYTDGITEAFNRDREQYGIERLKDVLLDNNKLSTEEIRNKIYEDLTFFINNAPMEDDLTFLILKKDTKIDNIEEL